MLLAFSGPIILSAAQRGFVYDDPFILARYAQHIADGVGWQFNPGGRTGNAVTSPLYVLILAGGAAVGLPLLVWSAVVYVAAWGCGGIVLARVLMRDGRQAAGWVACGLYSIAPLLANVRGMETSLYLLLILGAVWAVQHQRWVFAGVLLGLLAVTRADGVLIGAVFLTWMLLRHRGSVLQVGAPFVGITAAWTAVLWAITGSPVPTTLAAKIAQRDSGMAGGQWGFLRYFNVIGVMGASDPPPAQVLVLGWLGMIVLALAIWGTIAARRDTALPILAVIAAVVMIEYGVVFRMMPSYMWHYAPFTLWAIAGTAVGVETLSRRTRAGAAVAVAVAVLGAFVAFRAEPIRDRAYYPAAAEWIDHDSTKPHPTVATSEIGTIGYFSRANIIDYMGLLDHRAIAPVRHGDFSWWLTQHPDYWVTGADQTWDAHTMDSPEFRREYHQATQVGSLTIYRRN